MLVTVVVGTPVNLAVPFEQVGFASDYVTVLLYNCKTKYIGWSKLIVTIANC